MAASRARTHSCARVRSSLVSRTSARTDLGFTRDRHLRCASRVNPTCVRAKIRDPGATRRISRAVDATVGINAGPPFVRMVAEAGRICAHRWRFRLAIARRMAHNPRPAPIFGIGGRETGRAPVELKGVPMSTGNKYHAYARACLRWAASVQTEEQRKQLLTLASDWTRSALELEGVSVPLKPAPKTEEDSCARQS
jgi:hypothetical protein